MAAIRKRGDGQWEARIRKQGYPTTCKTFTLKADAEKWAKERESEMERGLFVSRKESEGTTLEECLHRYEKEIVPTLANPNNYVTRIKRLVREHKWLVIKRMAQIRSKDIADFALERGQNIKPRTLELDLILLSRVFHFAARRWGMEDLRNPVELVEMPKYKNERSRRISSDEKSAILEVLRKSRSKNAHIIFELALETAMRLSEVGDLRWSWINFDGHFIHIPPIEKRKRDGRPVPLTNKAVQILQGIAHREGQDRVFKIKGPSASKLLTKYCNKLGIENLHFHDTRHERSSQLGDAGFSEFEIKAQTGHRSTKSVDRYVHTDARKTLKRIKDLEAQEKETE